jgi:CelD/BcsL family acetyltransferase involved in cellulose biosynthesis
MPLEPWDAMLKKLSKSFRQNLRTANNRAKAVEGLRIESANSLPQLDAALQAFIEVEASGWKSSIGTAIKQSDPLKSFYGNLIRKFGPQGQCEIHLLRQNDRPIAGLFLLYSANTLYIPKVGYDEEFSRISPVQLLLEHVFKQNEHRPGITELNLTSDAGWFDVWKPTKSPVSNVYVFNDTPRGIAAHLAMQAAEKLKSRRRAVAT